MIRITQEPIFLSKIEEYLFIVEEWKDSDTFEKVLEIKEWLEITTNLRFHSPDFEYYTDNYFKFKIFFF